MTHNHTWDEAQAEELAFWNTPGAELGEQLKQLTYAKYMGIEFMHDGSSPYVIDKTGLDILDIGGGPVSLLLKTHAETKVVVDPCTFAPWTIARYNDNGVEFWHMQGEEIPTKKKFDEVWLYNVLQHTESPQRIFENVYKVMRQGSVFRFIDWVDTPKNIAHPISLTYEQLDAQLSRYFDQYLLKKTIDENGAVGTIAYGVFTK